MTISALGDASSLQGGTLLVTPMIGADGEVYAVAQARVTIGGFSATGAAESVLRGVPTSGRIARGAIVEREVPFDLAGLPTVNIALRNPDFTTARRIADAVNTQFGREVAYPQDSGTVVLNVSMGGGDPAALLTDIESLPIDPDLPAKVVIDENTGVIVMGDTVRISKVAVAQGNLTIRITETPQVSQPNPFSNTGVTVVVPRTNVEVQEDGDRSSRHRPRRHAGGTGRWTELAGRQPAGHDLDLRPSRPPARCRPAGGAVMTSSARFRPRPSTARHAAPQRRAAVDSKDRPRSGGARISKPSSSPRVEDMYGLSTILVRRRRGREHLPFFLLQEYAAGRQDRRHRRFRYGAKAAAAASESPR